MAHIDDQEILEQESPSSGTEDPQKAANLVTGQLPEEVNIAVKIDNPSPAATKDNKGSSSLPSLDHTAQTPENQEKERQNARSSMARRLREVEQLQREKEELVLSYISHDVPKPYYERWKSEANDVFTLSVRLKNRLKKRG